MANLIKRKRPSSIQLQRDLDNVFDDLEVPRSFRREVDRLFDEIASPRSLWREMDRLMEDFESPPTLGSRIARVFQDFLGESRREGAQALTGFVPSLDLVEKDNEYVMKADLPGMREQDINVEVGDDNVLTISGERSQEENKNVRGYQYSERSYGSFSRSIELPRGVDASKVKAEFNNGVLEVRFPKGEPARARKIPLWSGQERRNLSSGGGDGQSAQTQQAQPQNQTQPQLSGRS